MEGDKQCDTISLPSNIDFSADDIKLLLDVLYGKHGDYIHGDIAQQCELHKCKVNELVVYNYETCIVRSINSKGLYSIRQLPGGSEFTDITVNKLSKSTFAITYQQSSPYIHKSTLSLDKVVTLYNSCHYFQCDEISKQCVSIINKPLNNIINVDDKVKLLRLANKMNMKDIKTKCVQSMEIDQLATAIEELLHYVTQ